LTIALDATYSLDRNLTGVGVYSRQLLFGVAEARPDANFLFCYRAHRLFRSFRDRLPRNAARAWLRSDGYWPYPAQLFHGLNQRVDSVRAKHVVSTFHDLFVLTGDYSTYDFRVRFAGQARKAAERSDLLIAVSEFTADQLVNVLSVERSRIRVIHHGVARPAGKSPAEDAEREDIILHVGALQHRKNISRLVEAFEAVTPGWKLVLVGSDGYGAAEIRDRIAHSKRASDIELRGYVNTADLERLYSTARVFAFPSLDEGFGMPILDAMARGVPVLTSNRSATKEVAGAAALLIDPSEVDSIASGLRRVTSSPALRNQLRKSGLLRAAEFSWSKAVAQTWQVYEESLGRRASAALRRSQSLGLLGTSDPESLA
jgi:glycosyltransferase involved in cell wall biosynthesis